MAGTVTGSCDFGDVAVTAEDDAFDGIPDEVPAGTTVFALDNAGTEFHEVAVLRTADGEERPVDELLALPRRRRWR